MPNRPAHLIILLFLIATEGLHGQVDTSAASFFPLHIGDYWEYIFINNPPLEPSERFWSKVTSDTVMSNGKKYFKIVGGLLPYGLAGANYVRIDDSLNVYVYTRAAECPDSEYVMFRLAVPDSTIWPFCVDFYEGKDFISVMDTYDRYYQYLELQLPTKWFCAGYIDTLSGDTAYCALGPTPAYHLAKGIGIALPVFEASGPAYLVGAIINGKQYGHITSVQEKDEGAIMQGKDVIHVFPNPFNESTRVRYFIPSAGYVSLILYDMLGKKVKSLVEQNLKAGTHEFNLDGRGLSSGLYVIVLRGPNFDQQQRIILLK